MGVSYSTTNRREHLSKQVSQLGDRYPFGDNEILRLVRCHAYLELCNRRSREGNKNTITNDFCSRSFLSSWATFCPTLAKPDWSTYNYYDVIHVDECLLNQKRLKWQVNREILMNGIESKILPKGFGQRLEKALFLRTGDSSIWRDCASSSATKSSKFFSTLGDRNNDLIPTDESTAMAKLEQFLDGASKCSRRGGRESLTALFHCCSASRRLKSGKVEQMVEANEILHLVYSIALATACLVENDCSSQKIDSFVPKDMQDVLSLSLLDYVKSVSNDNEMNRFGAPSFQTSNGKMNVKSSIATITDDEEKQMVSLQSFVEWSEQYVPNLSSCLPTFFHYIFFPDAPYPPSRTSFNYPDLKGEHSAFFSSRNSPHLFTLASMSPSLGGGWHRLFTSDSDGISFNRLQNALLGYSGPTLILIQEVDKGGIFGAFTSSPWKESKDFYGNSDCFLFRLTPTAAIYHPRGAGKNFMYCNSKARSKGYDGQAHGIGFGGTVDCPRLFISETFEGCVAASGDMTFKAGYLLPPPLPDTPATKYFDIESIEVWGVGGDDVVEEALGSRDRQREIAFANIQKARKVDKAQFLDDFNSGLFSSKAFAHKQQVAGRVDVCVSDDEE